MDYRVIIEKPAMKFIRRQPKEQQARLLRAIQGLPESGDIKPMSGMNGLFRLRVGTYRVIYSIENDVLIVRVLNAGNRGDVYK